jgi:beta-glucanase (GH16 family)
METPVADNWAGRHYSNGIMNMRMHTINGVPQVAAPEPKINGSTADRNQLYGRYEARFRADAVDGYKLAWLLWPKSGVWPRDGEIDFPEGDLQGSIGAFMHRQNGSSGGDQDGYKTSAKFPDWHTAVIEWKPNSCKFILDGNQSDTRRAGCRTPRCTGCSSPRLR